MSSLQILSKNLITEMNRIPKKPYSDSEILIITIFNGEKELCYGYCQKKSDVRFLLLMSKYRIHFSISPSISAFELPFCGKIKVPLSNSRYTLRILRYYILPKKG